MATTVTREDRAAASHQLAKRKPGDTVTARELELADEDHTVVCQERQVTGSHITTRECMTMRQKKEKEQKEQQRARERSGAGASVQEDPRGNPSGVVFTGH
ncbi:MAG TPA: hypothetical protein VND93_31070 [Myxococcales bacterium]|nr:hypothetical protein [Myxococcales bacterium]